MIILGEDIAKLLRVFSNIILEEALKKYPQFQEILLFAEYHVFKSCSRIILYTALVALAYVYICWHVSGFHNST